MTLNENLHILYFVSDLLLSCIRWH